MSRSGGGRRRRRPPQSSAACVQPRRMGQQPSKQRSQDVPRLAELRAENEMTLQLIDALRSLAVAEKLAGIPATQGSDQARYNAAREHLERLRAERRAIYSYQSRSC